MSENAKRISDSLSSKYWCWEIFNNSPGPVLELFLRELPHIDPNSWLKREQFGGIFVNGLKAQLSTAIIPPCKVEYYEPKYEISDASSYFPSITRNSFIYEDEDLLLVYKPPKLPSLPGKEQTAYSLRSMVEVLLGQNVHMPSRLDTSAQGLVIISKSPRMHPILQRAYQYHLIEKRYLIKVASRVPWESYGVCRAIGKSEHPILRKVVQSNGKFAISIFRKIWCSPKDMEPESLIEVSPRTGRTHQIRVHAHSIGVPIIGDNFYQGKEFQELCLLSYSVKFFNPIKREYTEFKVPEKLMPKWAFAAGSA